MTAWSSYSVGRYFAGEGDAYIGPKNYRADATVRGVVYCHGHGQRAQAVLDPVNTPNQSALIQSVAKMFPVVSCDLGGDQWANATHIARIGSAVTWLQSTWGAKAGKVLLIGTSMGNAGQIAYAAANPTLVAGIVGILPLSDLQDIATNNRGGSAAEINALYAGGYSDATYGNTHNPVKIAATAALGNIPIRLYYASDDATVIPATVTTFGAAQASATLVNLGAVGGHSEGSVGAVSIPDVLAFLRANA